MRGFVGLILVMIVMVQVVVYCHRDDLTALEHGLNAYHDRAVLEVVR